jgi:triosephosphate isomerase
MNKNVAEMEIYFQKFAEYGDFDNAEVVFCPPMPLLPLAVSQYKNLRASFGAQNVFWEESGAYTGEVSPLMLRDIGAQYVIIGHSERRNLFGETDQNVSRKVKAAVKVGLKPIVCIGESLMDLRSNRTEEVINEQVSSALSGLDPSDARRIIIAYEPVWAIGSGLSATSAQAKEVAMQVRKLTGELYSLKIARELRILYGGSVNPDNVDGFTDSYIIHGALVGNASLDPEMFASIIKNGGGIKQNKSQQNISP